MSSSHFTPLVKINWNKSCYVLLCKINRFTNPLNFNDAVCVVGILNYGDYRTTLWTLTRRLMPGWLAKGLRDIYKIQGLHRFYYEPFAISSYKTLPLYLCLRLYFELTNFINNYYVWFLDDFPFLKSLSGLLFGAIINNIQVKIFSLGS